MPRTALSVGVAQGRAHRLQIHSQQRQTAARSRHAPMRSHALVLPCTRMHSRRAPHTAYTAGPVLQRARQAQREHCRPGVARATLNVGDGSEVSWFGGLGALDAASRGARARGARMRARKMVTYAKVQSVHMTSYDEDNSNSYVVMSRTSWPLTFRTT
eukprot:360154-Chlamydomonas_euryale.AAC.3